MGKSAWRDFELPDDGAWTDLKPGDDGYDPVLASASVALMDRPDKKFEVSREVGVFFGCQLGWSPEREGGRNFDFEWACDMLTKEVLTVAVCHECLSGLMGHLPSRVVCMGCLRYSEDPRIAALNAHRPPPALDKD